jgi:hypothetical protein
LVKILIEILSNEGGSSGGKNGQNKGEPKMVLDLLNEIDFIILSE